MYDLKLIPIHQEKGQPIPQQTGFLAASPPRRAARSRAEDLLILSFSTQGGERPSGELQDAWLAKLVETFFKTGGSVTSALRSLIETLNLTMMEKNLKAAKGGAAVTGAINLAAIHHRAAYVAQSGLTHAFVLNQDGVAHFHDTSQTDRGLGLSRTPTIRYYQAELGTGGYLFMTTTPAVTWTNEQLCKDGFPNLEQLRRRLLNQAAPNLRLDLVQILPGEGEITTVRTAVPAADRASQEAQVAAVETLNSLQEAPAPQTAQPGFIEETPQPEPDAILEEAAFEDTQQVLQEVETVDVDAPEENELPEPDEPGQVSGQEEREVTPTREEELSAVVTADEGIKQSALDQGDQVAEKPEPPKRSKTRRTRKDFNDQVDVVREKA
jgi:hypothetical protein